MSRRVEFTLSEEMHAAVEDARGDVPRAAWIKRALEAALETSDRGTNAGTKSERHVDSVPPPTHRTGVDKLTPEQYAEIRRRR